MFVFLHWVVVLLCFPETSLLSDTWFANIFSYCTGCLFSLSWWYHWAQMFQIVMSYLSVAYSVAYAFHVLSKKAMLNPRPQNVYRLPSKPCFQFWCQCLMCFQLTFYVVWVRGPPGYFACLCTSCWKDDSFPIKLSQYLSWNSNLLSPNVSTLNSIVYPVSVTLPGYSSFVLKFSLQDMYVFQLRSFSRLFWPPWVPCISTGSAWPTSAKSAAILTLLSSDPWTWVSFHLLGSSTVFSFQVL